VFAQPRADRIVVHKSARTMELMSAGHVIKTYKIALGGDPVGPKTRQGDHKTPEGIYMIDGRQPHSHYHLALHISYPSKEDEERARAAAVEPGGDIMIHGLKDGERREGDWTQGCIAVTDEEMDEIWGLVSDGTAIEIEP